MSAEADAAREALRAHLTTQAAAHVDFDGWTWRALEAGARDLGLDGIEARRLFPGGPADLFRAFSDWADERMAEALEARGVEEMRLNERVRAAVLARFEALAPYREAVRRGIAFAALPRNGALGPACFGRTVDRVWRLAGDRSADFSYYTKRALLAGVLASTTLVWLDDRGADSRVTREFLARRIADVLRIQRARSRVERVAARLADPRGLRARRGPRVV